MTRLAFEEASQFKTQRQPRRSHRPITKKAERKVLTEPQTSFAVRSIVAQEFLELHLCPESKNHCAMVSSAHICVVLHHRL